MTKHNASTSTAGPSLKVQPKRAPADLRPTTEWSRVTLASIADAAITADSAGCVKSLNPVAEALTGWTLSEAAGQPLERVFRIINAESREPVENPTVRALRDRSVAPMSAGHPSPSSRTDRPSAGLFRVLVVHDNLDMAESLALLVKAAGHDVLTAHDGPTALQVAREYQPHAMLLDIGLPGLDGYEVAKRMREQAW